MHVDLGRALLRLCFRWTRKCARCVLLLFLIAASITIIGANLGNAVEQTWPKRPIILVVPYPPGGTTDFQARIISARLSDRLGQPIVVQNKAGAAGVIATEYVVRAQPDGYTLLFGSSAQITSVPMTETVNYTLDDLIPICASGNGPMILAINSKIPVHSLPEFIDYGKAHPGKLAYASAGTGSVAHLAGALFVAKSGMDALHVPFRGAGPAMVALLSAQVDFYFGNSADLMPHATDSNLRILAVSTPRRMSQLPDVPAVAEAVPGFTLTAWQGFLAPAKTPQSIVDRLAKEVSSIAQEPTVIERLASAGVQATSASGAEFMEIIQKERPIYAEAIKAAGLQHN